MSEKKLSEEQEKKIAEIKEQWANEMCPLLDKWEEEERMLRKENPQAPRELDKHLKETVAIEKKYQKMIKQVVEEC